MKRGSAVAKGRRLSSVVADIVRAMVEGEPGDVTVTPSGINGPDVQLSPYAKRRFPFAIECKNQEKLSIWSALKQCEDNAKKFGGIPMLVFGRNRTQPYVCIPLSDLPKIYQVPYDVSEVIKT